MKINKNTLFLALYVLSIGTFAFAGAYFYADYQINIHKRLALQGAPEPDADIAYIDLPRISVTLSSPRLTQAGNVRMDLMLEVEGQYAKRIQDYRARIIDGLIRYTQTLDYTDMAGPKATVWLKPELLKEVNDASNPVPVRDIVFREFVVF